MEDEFEVWGVPAGQIPFQPIRIGTYHTQGDADFVRDWLQRGRAWTNLHIRQSSPWLKPEVKP